MTATKKIDFAAMNSEQIAAIMAEAKTALVPAQEKQKADCMAELATVAERHGFTLQALFPTRAARTPSNVSYINPENAAETWSGRGRKPGWLHAFETAGGTLESIAA